MSNLPEIEEPDFFLVVETTDRIPPLACEVLRLQDLGSTNLGLLVKFERPLRISDHENPEKDSGAKQALLIPRQAGASMLDFQWPKFCHVIIPLVPDAADRDTLFKGEFVRPLWGETYPALSVQAGWLNGWGPIKRQWEEWLERADRSRPLESLAQKYSHIRINFEDGSSIVHEDMTVEEAMDVANELGSRRGGWTDIIPW